MVLPRLIKRPGRRPQDGFSLIERGGGNPPLQEVIVGSLPENYQPVSNLSCGKGGWRTVTKDVGRKELFGPVWLQTRVWHTVSIGHAC